MLEEADKCSKGAKTLPSENGESSVLRRILGSSGNSANTSFGSKLSSRRRKMHFTKTFIQAQQAIIDAVLEPEPEGMPATFTVKQEPHRSSCFANLQKLRSEISKQPSPHDLYKTSRHSIISVKEMKQNEEQDETNDTLTQGEIDGRPLKSLHWRALGQRHKCEGSSSNCEKCKRVFEVRKATERFQAKRAAKQVLKESNSEAKDADEKGALGDGVQRIKREERFCRNASARPNARTVVQKSKTAPDEDVSCFLIGGNSKWAQPVLSEMPEGVYKGRSIQCRQRAATPMPVEGEIMRERDERKTLSCVSRLKFIREYLDDEPDFESEEITSWELAPRSQTDVIFTLPCRCERKFAAPRPLKPRILLIDMSCGENDDAGLDTIESRGIAPLRKLMPRKTLVRGPVRRPMYTGRTGVVMPLEDLEEKDSVEFECDSEGKL